MPHHFDIEFGREVIAMRQKQYLVVNTNPSQLSLA